MGKKVLRALRSGLGSAEEIAQSTAIPLFRVRSGLRELIQAGLASQTNSRSEITEKGVELIE